MDGILPVFKERGMTSHDVVFKLRKILHTKKIGHSGTLDPNVDGVLPVAVGKATKTVEFLMASGKQYKGEITFGFATTTEDLDGEEVERVALERPFTAAEIDAGLASLTGTIKQIPPMFSAVKVNGRKLYEYARAGEEVERPVREITISEFKQTKPAIWNAVDKTQTAYFEVGASKGTYVRTLAVDAGKFLGVPAVMSDLTRTKSGGFTIDQAVKLAGIQEAMDNGTIDDILLPIDYALDMYPIVALNDELWGVMKNGGWFDKADFDSDAAIVRVQYHDDTKALYQWSEEKQVYKPLKMFSNQ
ncbi:tRNA pseudouridine(55) synthase TruB [Periweissella cryptocerci]|uniref:tRNA pseudouridine synthase B n=1 Tax=Periweissella cryptocerci TaxID=2506420 RepID=A0A4P6YWB0_9LACO|nr:tRNA pseudouridine(55) synthase TruB [Periweissella cryptocerci]QBO37142.1 tRNA pseudouridine(55) synthase TruB [Periweissella cryptocerci]